jgi:hypothetical protein
LKRLLLIVDTPRAEPGISLLKFRHLFVEPHHKSNEKKRNAYRASCFRAASAPASTAATLMLLTPPRDAQRHYRSACIVAFRHDRTASSFAMAHSPAR